MPTRKKTSNPGGQGELRALARQHGPAAFERLLSLLDSKDERLALAVAQEILNRAYGKPDSSRDGREDSLGRTVVLVRGDRGETLNKDIQAGEKAANDAAPTLPLKKRSRASAAAKMN